MIRIALLALALSSPIQISTGIVTDPVTIDARGQYWEYDTENSIGSEVAVIFDTNGTMAIEDDVIITLVPID